MHSALAGRQPRDEEVAPLGDVNRQRALSVSGREHGALLSQVNVIEAAVHLGESGRRTSNAARQAASTVLPTADEAANEGAARPAPMV